MPRKGPISSTLSVLPTSALRRPDPPAEFTLEEAAVWRSTVGAMKPGWFGPETHPLLSSYVFHVVVAQDFAARLRAITYEHPDYRELLKAHRAESKMMMALARTLRLTPRSDRLGNDGRASDRFHRKPWELEDEPA